MAKHQTPIKLPPSHSAAIALDPAPIQIHIPARAEYVRVVRLAIAGVAGRMAFSFEDVENIKLAVSEACNNAILHARRPPKIECRKMEAQVIVTLTEYSDRLEILVADEGRVETPNFQAPAAPSGILPEHGWGLLLIRSLMDEVEHFSGPDSNTVLRMVKHIDRHMEAAPTS